MLTKIIGEGKDTNLEMKMAYSQRQVKVVCAALYSLSSVWKVIANAARKLACKISYEEMRQRTGQVSVDVRIRLSGDR